MSTADHVTCCCAETLADIERLTQERDDARDTLACPGYLTDLDAMPDPTPIIEWLASVGLDAQRIPAREPTARATPQPRAIGSTAQRATPAV